MIASSNSSPATRSDVGDDRCRRAASTAISVVPPPMSTIMRAARLGHRQIDADAGGHRLVDQVDASRAGALGRVDDGAALDGGDADGHRDHDAAASRSWRPSCTFVMK